MSRRKSKTFINCYNHETYNHQQIGNNEKTIRKVYDYLKSLNLLEDDIDTILYDLSYTLSSSINLPLFLNLMTKSIDYKQEYTIDNILIIVRQIHDIYNGYQISINLEEYLNSNEDTNNKNMYLSSDNKYILRNFKNNFPVNYIVELKYAAAMKLSDKDYLDYVSYLDDYQTLQETYSPLLLFKSYTTIREDLQGNAKLFWDLLLGNEYIISLYRNNILINQMFKENTLSKEREIKTFQISSIYANKNLPIFNSDQEFLMYYRHYANTSENEIILPKLKEQ